MSGNWQEFLKKQRDVYGQIRAKQVDLHRSGTEVEQTWAARRGAFGIALLHPFKIADQFAELSYKISQEVPAVEYRPWDIHTSLVGTPFEQPFLYKPNDKEHRRVLRALVRVATKTAERFGNLGCPILYRSYLYTPQAVIAAGQPQPMFIDLVEELRAECVAEGLAEVRTTWGAHATISRFTSKCPADNLGGLIPLLERSSVRGPGISFATQIAVGYSLWGLSPEFPGDAEYNGHFAPYQKFKLC
ncbi:MAG: hypothetical protein AAB449_00125 [Patescibacteria group bacterium]